MINLKSDPKPSKEAEAQMCPCYDEPAYPYGLTLCLNSETLTKLGLKTMPAIGAKLRIVAVATVTSVSQRQEADGDEQRTLELQVTDMDPPKPAGSMYENSGMDA